MSINNKDPNYGRILANRYQLAELVGEGAMGKVYRAKDTVLGGVTVAVKFLSQALLNNNMRDRFEREATISALLGEKSIHVVRVKDYGVDEHNIPFYVMEFLSGEDLDSLLRYQPLSLSRFLTVTRHICLALESAHQGILFNGELCTIIHRDIKPSNIVIIQDPTLGEIAKILDFGIAKLVLADASQTQSFMGTLAYCSPEQMEGKELDHRSDIYSLGIMMYEMLTTDMPILPQNSSFGGWYQAHHDFQPEPFDPSLNIPQELQDLVIRCMAKAKDKRPQNVREILNVIDSLQQNNNGNKIQFNSFPSAKLNYANFNSDETISNVPFVTQNFEQDRTVEALPSLTEICLQIPWPSNKPLQKIVFSNLINTPLGDIPSIFVMLDYQDISKRMSSIRYNQFLYLNHPHPMLLWITLLFHRDVGPRWLPCYIDLKSSKGQKLVRTLSDLGSYRILFFAIDRGSQCQNALASKVNGYNCNMLKQWANTAQLTSSTSNPQNSKEILRRELEKIKPKILLKMETNYTNMAKDMS
ncbi:MAG: serine/threonine-protein kinase [Stanieria sp.]